MEQYEGMTIGDMIKLTEDYKISISDMSGKVNK